MNALKTIESFSDFLEAFNKADRIETEIGLIKESLAELCRKFTGGLTPKGGTTEEELGSALHFLFDEIPRYANRLESLCAKPENVRAAEYTLLISSFDILLKTVMELGRLFRCGNTLSEEARTFIWLGSDGDMLSLLSKTNILTQLQQDKDWVNTCYHIRKFLECSYYKDSCFPGGWYRAVIATGNFHLLEIRGEAEIANICLDELKDIRNLNPEKSLVNLEDFLNFEPSSFYAARLVIYFLSKGKFKTGITI